jgi:flagellar hook protein FlgE
MIGALWTGISGLASQQSALDNESNNIANVNTVGYKASRVSFADLMYQDSIGKGSSITSAEKQYTQGTLNVTGSSYDVALNGDGFFVVSNVSSTGTSESYYTRAGNFRMGDNGTLQDASGNEVQGWALSAIDKTADVTSTNSNLSSFTDDFTEIAGNQIIQFSNKIQTYAAKTSDYSTSAKSDSTELSGSGIKTQSAKISDIEALITKYSDALGAYALNPENVSSPSIAQSTVIDYPNTSATTLNEEGDQIYVYINGDKIYQDYVDTTATSELKAELDAAGITTSGTTTVTEYNALASRIATYKSLSDQISSITGLEAYTVKKTTVSGVDTYTPSTSNVDVLTGTIKINSINPGVSFTIGDINEVSGTTETAGTKTTLTEAVTGTGKGAVTSAMEALRDAVAGTQQDVYESTDILSDDNGTAITFATGDTISFTIGSKTLTSSNTATTSTAAINDLITKINTDPTLSTQVEAKNINGKLVIESKDTGVEFSGIMKFTDASATTTYTKEKNLDLSGNSGAGAEFMEIVSTVDQTSSKNSLQLKLDSLGLTDSSFGEFSVDSSGIITMKQDGVEYAIGQIAIAQFNNNIELEAVGDNLLSKTKESGEPIYSINNDNGVSVKGETLELSTADLSESLVNLMVFQRAFEANAKTITTADDILQTLIGLKR